MQFKAIIFDAGDILYDATPWRKWLTGQLQQHGVKVSYLQLVERWEALLVDVYVGKADYWKRLQGLLSNFGLKPDQVNELVIQARQKGKDVQVGRKPFDGVPQTLAELKDRGVKLAVLSDTESTAQKVRKGLDVLGIGRYFDMVITSFDIGFVKPQPQAFAAALDRLAVQKEQAAFVAHDEDELTGAMQFGLKAIAFNQYDGVRADIYIKHFSELSTIAGL